MTIHNRRLSRKSIIAFPVFPKYRCPSPVISTLSNAAAPGLFFFRSYILCCFLVNFILYLHAPTALIIFLTVTANLWYKGIMMHAFFFTTSTNIFGECLSCRDILSWLSVAYFTSHFYFPLTLFSSRHILMHQ